MSAYFIETPDERFDPTWLEFDKPIFIKGYGYVGSVSLDGQVPDRPDRPSVAGCSKTPDGWVFWMNSGAAALVPDTNVKYVGCVRVQAQKPAALSDAATPLKDQAPEVRFAHLPDGVREKIIAQATKGEHGGDAALAQMATAMGAMAPAPEGAEQPTGGQGGPVKKRRGRPPKVRPPEELPPG